MAPERNGTVPPHSSTSPVSRLFYATGGVGGGGVGSSAVVWVAAVAGGVREFQ